MGLILLAGRMPDNSDIGAIQTRIAAEMGLPLVQVPSPTLTAAFDLAVDGRTQGLTTCYVILGVVLSIQYADHIDYSKNEWIVRHELEHARQCISGDWRRMTADERERAAEAAEHG